MGGSQGLGTAGGGGGGGGGCGGGGVCVWEELGVWGVGGGGGCRSATVVGLGGEMVVQQ